METIGCVTFTVPNGDKTLEESIKTAVTQYNPGLAWQHKISVVPNRAFMAAALEEDVVYRRTISWPSIPYSDVVLLNKTFQASSRTETDDLCRLTTVGWFTLEHDEQKVITNLKTFFPRIDMILEFGKGSIVVAGGVFTTVCKSHVVMRRPPKDCDFFLWGIKDTRQAEALVREICLAWLKLPDTEVYQSDHVTTLLEPGPTGQSKRSYQIIHRVYPNKMSIIGGFDLAPSMVLYDGDSVLFTPLSALSYAFRFFFVDISRQSKSFSTRIAKYSNRGFHPTIACKTHKEIYDTIRSFGLLPATGNIFVRIAPTYGITIGDRCVKNASSQLMHEAEVQTEDYDAGMDLRSQISLDYTNAKLLASGQVGSVVKKIGLPDLEPIGVSYFFGYIEDFPGKVAGYHSLNRGVIRQIKSYYGEDANFIDESTSGKVAADFMREKMDALREKVETIASTAMSKSEVVWYGIDENPSRQLFTSSFKPIDQQGSWCSPMYAKPLYIGVPFEVYKTVWIGRIQKECIFSLFSRDLFRYFMTILRSSYQPESPTHLLLRLIKEVVPQ